MAKLDPKLELVKLIDELGTIDEQLKLLVPRAKEIKEIIKSHGPGVFDGKLFAATSTAGKMTFYKSELLKEYVSTDLLEKCEVTTAYLTVKTHRKKAVVGGKSKIHLVKS